MKIKQYIKEHKLKIALSIFLFAFALFLMLFLRMDIDYFWHFKAGEYMVNHGEILTEDVFSWSLFHYPWMSHEWLFEIFIYELSLLCGKSHLFVYTFSFVLLLLFFLFFIQKKEYLKNIPFSLVWISFFSLIFIGISGRPQLIGFFLLALSLWLIIHYFYHPQSKQIYFLPIISLIWANVHGGSSNLVYLLCLIVCFAGAFSFSFSKIEASRLSRQQIITYLVVAFLSILAITINPHGINMLFYPYQNMADSLMLSNIAEWQPSNLNMLSHYVYFVFAFLVLAIMLFSKKKIRFLDLVLYLFFLYLGLKSIRFWFFSYIAWSFFIFYYIPKRKVDSHTCLMLIFFAFLFIAVFVTQFSYSKIIETNSLSDDAIDVLKEKRPKRLFNYYDYGAYLIKEDIPVFIDGRADLYSKYIYEDYLTMSNLDYGFTKLFDKYQFDYFIVPKKSGIASYLQEKCDTIYKDETCIIFKTK